MPMTRSASVMANQRKPRSADRKYARISGSSECIDRRLQGCDVMSHDPMPTHETESISGRSTTIRFTAATGQSGTSGASVERTFSRSALGSASDLRVSLRHRGTIKVRCVLFSTDKQLRVHGLFRGTNILSASARRSRAANALTGRTRGITRHPSGETRSI